MAIKTFGIGADPTGDAAAAAAQAEQAAAAIQSTKPKEPSFTRFEGFVLLVLGYYVGRSLHRR